MPKAKVISIASSGLQPTTPFIELNVGPTRHVVDLRTGHIEKIGPADVVAFPPLARQLANPEEQSDRCDDRKKRPQGEAFSMLTFSIDRGDRIRVIEKTGAADKPEGSFSFRSKKELEELAKRWPIARLVSVWNGMAGAPPVRKFASRQIATARIWEAIQKLAPVPSTQGVKRKKAPAAQSDHTGERGRGSKKDDVIALLSAGEGVTLLQLMAATGWQKHSVRGFLSTLKNKKKLNVSSSKNAAGERVYSLAH